MIGAADAELLLNAMTAVMASAVGIKDDFVYFTMYLLIFCKVSGN
jgi:hypothetical protein